MSALKVLKRHWEWLPTIVAVAFIAAVLLGCAARDDVGKYTKALEVLL